MELVGGQIKLRDPVGHVEIGEMVAILLWSVLWTLRKSPRSCALLSPLWRILRITTRQVSRVPVSVSTFRLAPL